jgi:hypothetical protein
VYIQCQYCPNLSNAPGVAAGGPCLQTHVCKSRAKDEQDAHTEWKMNYERSKAARKAIKNKRREANLIARSQSSQDHASGKDRKAK